jgi:hypothetical protein
MSAVPPAVVTAPVTICEATLMVPPVAPLTRSNCTVPSISLVVRVRVVERAPVTVKVTCLPTKGLLVPPTLMKALAPIVTVSRAAICVLLGVSVS